jgi:hypothetical protein
MYIIDTLLVGLAFSSIKIRFGWDLTPIESFIILFILFALIENYTLPLVSMLNATITVGNEQIANFLELPKDYPLVNFFELGFFEFFTWCLQAFLAGLFGDNILMPKIKNAL